MLRMYRYLAIASAVFLLLALVLIAWFYNQQATRDLVEMTTKHNIAVDRILSTLSGPATRTISPKQRTWMATR